MHYEAEILPGLLPFAANELAERLLIALPESALADDQAYALPFQYGGNAYDLLALRTVVAVYRLLSYDIPRPKALLGHQNLHRLLDGIDEAMALHPPGSFRTFRFSAAGSDSTVFQRLRDAVGGHTRLKFAPDEADLLLRVRRKPEYGEDWEALIRLTPRPLATRDWRVCDMPGALNATVAAAMIAITDPRPGDVFFNPMCGSGTLLIERLAAGPADLVAGCDVDSDALECARQNITAAGLGHRAEAFEMDATALDLPDGSVTALCADLPWGQLSGERDELAVLYPAALREWARIAAPGARLAAITHAVSEFEALLGDVADLWLLVGVTRVFQGGLHPRIYSFARL